MFQIRMAPPSPFTKEEEKWVILEFGAVRNITMVKRSFRRHFKKYSQNVPSFNAFKRLVGCFEDRGEVNHARPSGRTSLSQETIPSVKNFILPYQKENVSVCLRGALHQRMFSLLNSI